MEVDLITEIVNTFEFGILIENADREITLINQKFFELFCIETKSQKVLNKNSIEVIILIQSHFSNISKLHENIDKIAKSGTKCEKTFNTIQGRVIKLKYVPIFVNSILKRHVWQLEDLTILKSKEREIRKQKEYYLNVLNKIPIDIVITSPNHEFQFINEHAISDKLKRDTLIGKRGDEYLNLNAQFKKEIIDKRNSYFLEAISKKDTVEYIEELPRKLGDTRFIYRSLQPITNFHNEVLYVVISGVDITKQFEIERNKQLQSKRFEKILNHINNAVFQVDFSGKIIFVNEAAFNLFPFFSKNSEGYYSFISSNKLTDLDRYKSLKLFQMVKQSKGEISGILTIGNKSEGEKYLKYKYWYVNTPEDGESVIGSLADVTGQFRELNAMRDLVEKEQHLNSLKSKFINITSHEIRTPLSVILSSAEIIDMVLPSDLKNLAVNVRDYTETIVEEVDNITNILNELLMIGEIESGNSKFKGDFENVHLFIDTITKRFKPYFDGRFLEIHISDEIDSSVFMDKKIMKHAIENLLYNAFKYSPGKKSPILSVFTQDECLVFTVQDFGIGIPKDEMCNLFQSFYRASNVSNISGTGIGLMVVEYASKMHNGSVEVLSELNEFTCFKLIIPYKCK